MPQISAETGSETDIKRKIYCISIKKKMETSAYTYKNTNMNCLIIRGIHTLFNTCRKKAKNEVLWKIWEEKKDFLDLNHYLQFYIKKYGHNTYVIHNSVFKR